MVDPVVAKVEETAMQSVVTRVDAESGPARTRHLFDAVRRSKAASLPQIQRQGIRWSGGVGRRNLVIELDFENRSAETTCASSASVQIARFGAFVPWSPLTAVHVPPIPPEGHRTVTAIVDPDDARGMDVPGLGARSASIAPRRGPLGALWRRLVAAAMGEATDTHFVGNLNVLVGGSKPVERHVTRLKLDRQRTNLAVFHVGDGRLDEYTFSFEAGAPGWTVEIHGVEWGIPVVIASSSLTLLLEAPAKVECDRVTLWVTRASTAQRVPVEFELGAAAGDAAAR
jgi:hypothetical protein